MAEREDPHTDPAAPDGPGGADAPDARNDAEKHRSFARIVGTVLTGIVAFVLACVLIVVLLLQTEWGAERAKNWVVLPLINNALQEGGELRVDRLRGTFISNLRLYDATVVDSTGQPLATADTASVDFNLLKLLVGRLDVSDAALVSPRITMHQREDSTWDLIDIFIAREDTAARGRLGLHLDAFAMRDGYLEMHFYPPESDSVLVADALDARLSEVRIDERLNVRLDTLTGRYVLPGTADSVHVAAAGQLADDEVTVGHVRLDSPNSFVRSAGTLRLPGDEADYVRDIQFELHADPLAFRDLHPFVPALNPDAVVTLDATASGTTRTLDVDLEGTTGDGATMDVAGTVTPAAEGPLTYDLDAQLRQLDPDYFTAGASEQPTVLNGDVSVDLAGTDLQSLTGTVDAKLFETLVSGLRFQNASIEGAFEDGAADLSVRAALRGGSFAGRAGGRFFDDVPTYWVEQGRIDDLNVAAFTEGDGQETSLTGTITGEGRGFDIETMAAEARLDLAPSTYGTYEIREAQAQLDFADEILQVDTDARLRGGRFDVSGALNMQGEVPSYRAEGQFYDVHLGQLTNNPRQQSDLNGQITLRGTGTDPETAEITADLRLRESSLDGQPIERGVASLTLQDGGLRFDVDFATPGGTFVARGTGTFVDGTVRYRITEGRFVNVDVAAFTGNPEQRSDLTGTFTAQGRGTDLDAMRVDARLDVAASRYGTFQIEDAQAQLTLANQQLEFSTDATLEGGQFDLSGSADLRGAVTSYRVNGQFQNVDIGALTDDPQQQSDLTGSLTVQGTGFDPATADITADLQLRNSTLNDQPVERGTAHLTVRDGDLQFDVDFATPGGSFAARGTADFGGAVVSYRIEEGRFEDLNIATFTGDTTQTSQLTGTFTAQGRGTDVESLVLDARVDLERSVYNEQVIEQGTARIDLDGGALELTADVQTPEGGITLRGTADLTAERPSFAIQEGTFSGVNLGALLNNPNLQTDLNGRIIVEAGGLDLADGRFDGIIELDRSRVNDAVITDARVAVELANGALDASGQVNFENGRATFDADALFAGDAPGTGLTSYGLEASLTRVDLGALTGADTLDGLASLDARLTGSGTDPETMEMQGYVTSDDITYGETAVETLRADFAVSDGVIAVDTLVLESTFADARAGGTLALWNDAVPSQLHLRADVWSLEPIRPFVPARTLAVEEAHLEGEVEGSRDTLRLNATGTATSFAYNDIRVTGFQGRILGTLDSLQTVRNAEMRAEVSYLSLPTLTVENAQVRANVDTSDVVFDGSVTLDRQRDAEFAGAIDLRPGRERLQIDRLNLQLDGDRWQLLQPATVTYDGEYRVSSFLLYADDQQIAIDGVIDPDGAQNLVVTVEEFRLDPVTDLLQYQGLGGTVTGSIDLTGPAAAPNLDGTLLTDLTSEGDPVGTLRLEVAYDSLRLQLDALLTHEDQSRLTAEGYITYDFNLASDPAGGRGLRVQRAEPQEGAIDFEIVADSFAIGWIHPFIDPETIDHLDGRLDGRADVDGTLEAPELSGEAQLVDGSIGLPQLEATYRDIQATATFDGNRIRISRARLTSGGGRLTAEGTIDLARLTTAEFNLDARARNFLVMDQRDLRAVADADVTLTGTQRRPVVTGDVRILSADFYLEDTAGADLQTVSLNDSDIQTLERHFGVRITEADTTTFDFYEASAIELDVQLERDTWVRARANPEMNIQLTGDVDFVKAPFEEEQVFGTIEVVEARSFVKQFGRRFNLTSGVLRFNGAATNPAIDASAEYQVNARNSPGASEVVITLSIEGRLQDPTIELGSEPSMEYVDIVSYIATGRPAGEGFQFEGDQGIVGRGTDIALSQMTALVEGLAAENLGLDVVEIQQEGLEGAVFTLGKYFTPRLYAAVRQPINYRPTGVNENTGTEFTVEYELLQWLLGRVTQQGEVLRFDLFWEYSY